VADPGAFAADLEKLQVSTDVLLSQVSDLTDAQARGPSLLPRWTRGHVLTHLARNADAMGNLVRWARTGESTPMYPSAEVRDADIEAGAGRPAGELLADLRDSAGRLTEALGMLATDAAAQQCEVTFGVPGPQSRYLPAAAIPAGRRLEVEVHHSDLGLGRTPADWPEDFARATLAARVPQRATPEGLAGITELVSDGTSWLLAPGGAGPRRALQGPVSWLAAWLMGRSVPDGVLRTSDGAPPPAAPPL
jgi:maleylpyruvate isomerase